MDEEKRIALDYAKENGLWIEDLYSLGFPLAGGGNENTLALDISTGALYKANNLFNSKFLVSNLLEQVRVHNTIFPDTKYELVGFTGIDHGSKLPPYIEVILKQEYFPGAVQATAVEVRHYMEFMGFAGINESTFTNGECVISDLYPRNVLKTPDGDVHVIDDIITEVGMSRQSHQSKLGALIYPGRSISEEHISRLKILFNLLERPPRGCEFCAGDPDRF